MKTPPKQDPKKVRQQARKIIGQAGLEQLAEHDAALVYHASEIETLRQRQDDMLLKAAAHAADLNADHRLGVLETDSHDLLVTTRCLRRPFMGRLRWLLTGR